MNKQDMINLFRKTSSEFHTEAIKEHSRFFGKNGKANVYLGQAYAFDYAADILEKYLTEI